MIRSFAYECRHRFVPDNVDPMSSLASRFLAGAICVVGLLASGEAWGDEAATCVAAAERAQEQRDLGKYASTRQALLVCSRESCPDVVRHDCQRWLGEVERSTPTVVISARDAEGRD